MLKPDQARREINALLKKWVHRLNLQEWTIDVVFMNGADPIDTATSGDTLADCSPDPVYLQAKIRIYPAWMQRDPWRREQAVVHELCHLITQPARDLVNDSRMGTIVQPNQVRDMIELLTQRVTNIALGTKVNPSA